MADSPQTILLVDDNTELLAILSESLKLMGQFAIATARTGVEALERYFEVHPACVVIDLHMPELDGFQLVRALRGDPNSAWTPLIIMTAMAMDKDRFAGLAAGADQYLLKPTKPRDLVIAIQEALRLSEAERKMRYQQLSDEPRPY